MNISNYMFGEWGLWAEGAMEKGIHKLKAEFVVIYV